MLNCCRQRHQFLVPFLLFLVVVWIQVPVSKSLRALVPPQQQKQQEQEQQQQQQRSSSFRQYNGNNNNNNNNKNNNNDDGENGLWNDDEQQRQPSRKQNEYKCAIVLNTNARSVSLDLVPLAESIFGSEHVHVTRSEEEAKIAAAKLISANISMVIPVGGDGTLSSMIEFLCQAIMQQQQQEQQHYPSVVVPTVEEAMKQLPLVAYIPMGTGNGVGSVVGGAGTGGTTPFLFPTKRRKLRHMHRVMKSYHDIAQHLKHNPAYLETEHAPDVIEIPMLQVSYDDDDNNNNNNHSLCFFAGAGFDSLMLQDFQSIKKWAIRTKLLTKTLTSVAGYCVALVAKTLPKCLARREHSIQVKLTTRDPNNTLWVDHRRGDVVQPCCVLPHKQPAAAATATNTNHSTLLFHGTTGILAASTTPFYGGGLRLFPFARMTRDKMHLRLGRIHPLRGFFNIPKIFEGSYRDKRSSSFGCLDFIGADFDVQIITTTTTDNDTTTTASMPEQQQPTKTQTKTRPKGFPVQHSGESVGYYEKFRLRVLPTPVKFVTLLEKRMICDDTVVST